ncbi:NUDIX hydrolase domain-like protein [Pilobolus umbonatus]|nr:NUDIX hydrolase domain-like protein [Pilobolus umbonatus]
MSSKMPTTPPPEKDVLTTVKYKKKARHGHGKDMTDIHNIRQVAGCLPIDPVSRRFLLISSSKNPDAWVIPKGGWEVDETQEHAALRETWEEAGLKGKITGQLGVFVERYRKKIRAHHWIFEMEISEIVKKYPERKKRDRRWFTYEEALVATQNNNYIQEAIKLSSISPHGSRIRLQRVVTADKELSIPSPSVTPSQSSSLLPTTGSKEPIVRPHTLEHRKSLDAFNTLKELMESSPITSN